MCLMAEQAALVAVQLRMIKLSRAVLELLGRVIAVVVVPPMVCKLVQAVAAQAVPVAACLLQATPVTDSQAVVVRVRHQTSQVLPPCTQVVVVVQEVQAPTSLPQVAWATAVPVD